MVFILIPHLIHTHLTFVIGKYSYDFWNYTWICQYCDCHKCVYQYISYSEYNYVGLLISIIKELYIKLF